MHVDNKESIIVNFYFQSSDARNKYIYRYHRITAEMLTKLR